MNLDQARGVMDAALRNFIGVDRYLLENDLLERCIAGRLAMHLQALIDGYEVDIEYNRAGALPKTLRLPEECANRRDEYGNSIVMPDIIVHRRGADGPNLMAIELKKSGNRAGPACDRMRIRAFREQMGYRYGILIECVTGKAEPSMRVSEWLGD
jgi:hypothetical protein